MPDWLQDLYDLLANETIKLVLDGEFNSINAELFIIDIIGKEHLVGQAIDAESLEEAILEVLKQAKQS